MIIYVPVLHCYTLTVSTPVHAYSILLLPVENAEEKLQDLCRRETRIADIIRKARTGLNSGRAGSGDFCAIQDAPHLMQVRPHQQSPWSAAAVAAAVAVAVAAAAANIKYVITLNLSLQPYNCAGP